MRNVLQKFSLLSLAVVFAVGFYSIPTAYAVEELVVDFEATPLFDEANFLPGNDVTRSVDVTNNSDSDQDIVVEAINVSDPNDFGDVLNLLIEEDGDELFNDSLLEFFDSGEVSLSELSGNGEDTTYDFTVYFDDESEDSYQEKSLGFDILIGFQGGESEPSGGGGGGGEGGGGGGGGPIPGLTITNEASEVVIPGYTTALITWQTNYFSTSQVIYGTTPGQFDFSAGPPNYGYEFSTVEDPTKVTFHEVTLTGLIPETTYYWRAVSHASPATISYEGTFSTCCPEKSELDEFPFIPPIEIVLGEIAQIPSGSVAGPGATTPSGGEAEPSEEDEPTQEEDSIEELIVEEQSQSEEDLSLFAGIFAALNLSQLGSVCWWLVIIVTILVIFYLLSRRKKEKKKYYWDLWAIIIILIILAIILKCYYLFIPILIIIGYLLYQKFVRK